MNIVHISHSDLKGGAAKASYRIHRSMLSMRINSKMLVQTKLTDDPSVHLADTRLYHRISSILAPLIDRFPLAFYGRNPNKAVWHPGWFQTLRPHQQRSIFNGDAFILYWICNGFLNIKTIAELLSFRKPIIWRLSDMWPFTGGCHYSGDCDRFMMTCGKCPQLKSNRSYDLSRRIINNKIKYWPLNHNPYFTVVSPSKWLAKQAAKSNLFKRTNIQTIRTGVDTQLFKPASQSAARKILNLPQNKFLILFGSDRAATDKRKGGHLLKDLLHVLRQQFKFSESSVEIVLFGTWQDSISEQLHYKVRALGRFQNDLSLPLVYSACDLFVSLSSEDNLPNTVIESLSCGTPCIAFRSGGIPEIIDHRENGYLSKCGDIRNMAAGVSWFLQKNSAQRQMHSDLARKKILMQFDIRNSVKQYLNLLKKHGNTPAA